MRDVVRSAGASPCAACKLLRRRCAVECVFAPYFPAEEPLMFASVHKVFGASNVNKMLQDLPEHQRGDAVSSMVYEANARLRDPVYGCVGVISSLQQQVAQLQTQLAMAQAEVMRLRFSSAPSNVSAGNPPEFSGQMQAVAASTPEHHLLLQYHQKPGNSLVLHDGAHQSINTEGHVWTN